MDLAEYLERKKIIPEAKAKRDFCLACRKPKITCYCASLKPIASNPRIVILMHPLEAKHPVGTGRMAHRSLSNSSLWIGSSFEDYPDVKTLVSNPKVFPLLLFPGPQSQDLSALSSNERISLFPRDREIVVIILDATWHLAKKMLHRTPCLQALPRISFTPANPSRFVVRKQPHVNCFSSIEAIHEILTLLNDERSNLAQEHATLLSIFDEMVTKQLSFRNNRSPSRHKTGYLNRKARLNRKKLLSPKTGSNIGQEEISNEK